MTLHHYLLYLNSTTYGKANAYIIYTYYSLSSLRIERKNLFARVGVVDSVYTVGVDTNISFREQGLSFSIIRLT